MRVDPGVIRLPARFVLTISGNRDAWARNPVPHEEMARMLMRLFAGDEAALSTFSRWQMRVDVEEDSDQGPEA